MSILRTKTGNELTDRALLDIYRRLGNTEQVAGVRTFAIGHLFTASDVTTTLARRWLAASASGALGTALATSGYIPVPPGFDRIESMSLAVNAAGTGTGTVTFTVTVGTPSTELETPLKITTLATFSGVRLQTGTVQVKPGDAIRVAVTKTATITAGLSGVGLMLVLKGE